MLHHKLFHSNCAVARSKLSNFVLHKRVWNMHKMDHMAAVDMTTKWKDGLIFLKKCGRHQLTTYCNDCISDLSSYRLQQQTPIRFYSSTVHIGRWGAQKSKQIKSEKMDLFFLRSVGSTNWRLIVIHNCISDLSSWLLLYFAVAQWNVDHGVQINDMILCTLMNLKLTTVLYST